jgi:hypothetical protein
MNGDASLPAMSRGGVLALCLCVLVPAGVIAICIGILFSGVLPPRSPRIADIGLIIGAMSLIEVVSFGVMVGSLSRKRIARTSGSVLTVILGGLSLLPAIVVAVIMIVSSLREGLTVGSSDHGVSSSVGQGEGR